MNRRSARATRAQALTILTPIVPGQEDELRRCLEGLGDADGVSPLVRLPGTHFARWVIVPDFVRDPSQPRPDPLDHQYLLFTSNLDGPVDDYLTSLCSELADEASQIWGRCIGCPKPAAGAALETYLRHNRIATGFFFAAYPTASVSRVVHCIDIRERLIRLAVATQGKDPAVVRDAFLEEFPP